MDMPKVHIKVPHAKRVFTSVTLNGVPIPALRVAFDTGDIGDRSGLVSLTLTFYADIELEGDLPTDAPPADHVWPVPPSSTRLTLPRLERRPETDAETT